MTRAVNKIEQLFISWWWVVLWLLVCYIASERVHARRQSELLELSQQIDILRIAKEKALTQQEVLKRQIQSQSDPAWVELTLMRGLGLVPEGQVKVYFRTQPN